jgi:hypothetical protein
MAGGQSGQTPDVVGQRWISLDLLTSVDPASRPRLHSGTVPGTVMSKNGHRLPGQLALGQVGKVVVAVPAVCRVLGPPGQLALRQVGKAANTRTLGWSA